MRTTTKALTLAALAVTAAAPALASHGRSVTARNLDFAPAAVTITKGQTVTWRFRDGGIPHNVTSRTFKSSSRTRRGGTHAVTFPRRGTFRYVCTIHTAMTGKVVVR